MRPRAELFRALGVLGEPPGENTRRLGELLGFPGEPDPSEYTEIFLLQAYPYASVYLSDEGMLGGEARDRVAGFWRAVGVMPPAEPDHVASLLGLYAELVGRCDAEPDNARRALRGEARDALLWEHILSWVPAYLAAVAGVATPFYEAWAGLLMDALADEARRTGAPAATPLHLRAARGIETEPEHGDAFLAQLLAPARSGMIVTRADLARAARDLGLGFRQGERRYILRAMLGSDPGGVLRWFAGHAARWVRLHDGDVELLGDVAGAWRARAASAAELLGRLGEGAEGTELDAVAR